MELVKYKKNANSITVDCDRKFENYFCSHPDQTKYVCVCVCVFSALHGLIFS